MKKILTFEKANQLVRYEPETGEMFWRVNRRGGAKAGDQVGHINQGGYWATIVDRVPIEMHRLAWLLYYGELPARGLYVDHINRIKTDNRIANLRIVDADGNAANRVRESYKHGGERGIAFDKINNKWNVSVPITKRKSRYIGCFVDIRDARIARDAAEKAIKLMADAAPLAEKRETAA